MRRSTRILLACAAAALLGLSTVAPAWALNPRANCSGTLNNALAQAKQTGSVRSTLAKTGPRAVGSQLGGLASACKLSTR